MSSKSVFILWLSVLKLSHFESCCVKDQGGWNKMWLVMMTAHIHTPSGV